jgi:SAM-dependent methyltransferase
LSLTDVSTELLARLKRGETYDKAAIILAGQLQDALEAALDTHDNRFAATRFYDLIRPNLVWLRPEQLKSATVVDLGCGSLNPFTFSFLLLMLGAARAYAIDLDPVQDPGKAVRALATAASWLLIQPRRILDPDSIDPREVLDNLHGFDLARLASGDSGGVAADRLIFRRDSIYDLSLDDGEADAVFSVSLLEHVDRVDDALASLHRITKPGGVGLHLVDFADHRIYTGEVESPFEFLRVTTSDRLLHGSNRLRCSQFADLFKRHGFDVERLEPARTVPLTRAEQAGFVEPFRSMLPEDLTTVCARIFVRRR